MQWRKPGPSGPAVSCAEPGSQWIRDAAASPNLRYFRFGRAGEAQAFVFIPGEHEPVAGSMQPLARLVAAMLTSAGAADLAFRILVDRG
jgi:hypothetical protein